MTRQSKQLHALPIVGGEPIRPHKFAGKPYPQTIEQMCRNLLEQAMEDGLDGDTDPQELSGGDLTGMANLLSEYLRGAR